MPAKSYVLSVLIVLIFAPAMMAELPPDAPQGAMIADNSTWIDANQILMFVTNQGILANDVSGVFGYYSGFFYPFTSIADIESGTNTTTCIYSTGLWVGGVDAVSGDTLVALAGFSTEFKPGPVIGGTFPPDATTNPAYRVYKIYSDSTGVDANTDYLEWPADQGAPVDSYGLPVLVGDQTLWTVFNDLDPAGHSYYAGNTDPLGLEIQQTVCAYGSGLFEEVVFIKYKVINKGDRNLQDLVLSMWCDPDVGGASDDYVGCDTLRSLGFSYNADSDDSQYGSNPPAVGIMLLQGPMEYTGDPDDNARMWGESWSGYRNLEMTSFAKYINGTDPDSYRETYWYMNGLLKDGSPYVYGGDILAYQCSGDPLTGVGDVDYNPSDRRFMMNTGPIDLLSGDSTELICAMMAAQSDHNLGSVAELMQKAQTVDLANPWDQGESLINLTQWRRADGGNDHWYAVIPQLLYWVEAEALARSLEHEGMNGYLATLHTPAENDFVLRRIATGFVNPGPLDEFWLGGLEMDGQWGWITGEPWWYTNWSIGEPNNPGVETALAMWGPTVTDWRRIPGAWNNACPDDEVVDHHLLWAIVEWGAPVEVVGLDVLPGTCPNEMEVTPFWLMPDEEEIYPRPADKLSVGDNLASETFQVAILGSDNIDVSEIDVSTLVLHDKWSPVSWHVEDVSAPVNYFPDPGGGLIPSDVWIDIYCEHASLDGAPLPTGAIIRAYDPQGVQCGEAVVEEAGRFGFMPIYGDSEFTPEDDGAEPGDLIRFTINDYRVITAEPVIYTENFDMIEVCMFSTPNYIGECTCTDITGDGYPDLVLDFNSFYAILAPPGVKRGDEMPMCISGALTDGTPIWGQDCIVLAGPSSESSTVTETKEPVLLGNYPNPFNPSTEIQFSLPAAAAVRLDIFNVLGQKVITLVDDYLEAGGHRVAWRGQNADGSEVASGMYLYRLQSDDFVRTRKMLLLK